MPDIVQHSNAAATMLRHPESPKERVKPMTK